jgi:uncharacterized protein YbjT (DUF2867 family)
MTMKQTLTVWLAGASGLVGRETLAALLEDPGFGRVVAMVRRPFVTPHAKLEERLVNFDTIEPALAGGQADVAICCLGTTIKNAGSREQFRRVDHDYVIAFARAARTASAQHFLFVSALGANSDARTFYSRVKGEVEEALTQLGFPALTIARPSLLLGERAEFRLGERLAALLMRFMPASIRGIEARSVGRALVQLARAPAHGKRIVLSDELQALGRKRPASEDLHQT